MKEGTANMLIDGWHAICSAYDDTREQNNPEITAKEILSKMSYEEAYSVLNAVAHIKGHDGRISNRNRSLLAAHDAYKDYFVWEAENPFIRAGLDHIHTAHIDNIISEILRLNQEGYVPKGKSLMEICVYCSSTDLYTQEEIDSENLTYLEFPDYIVRAFYMLDCRDASEEGFKKWLSEYTADDTDGLYFFAKTHGYAATR